MALPQISTGGLFRRRAIALLLSGVAVAGAAYAGRGLFSKSSVPDASAPTSLVTTQASSPVMKEVSEVAQVALLLDTSGSMDGLINQARSQLWSMVNELAQGRRIEDGVRHKLVLEIALYEYGTAADAEAGFIRQVLPFTRDLDQVSEKLFALKTTGSDEYCGQVMQTALRDLQWATSDNALKFMFIAGNESFEQGPVDPSKILADAASKHIDVQLIHCDNTGNGDPSWTKGAATAHTDLVSIDQNKVRQQIAAPQDEEISQLSAELNETYIAYGADGESAKNRQRAQDDNAKSAGAATATKRALVKGKQSYKNDNWDLVDATASNANVLGTVKESELPAEFRGKTNDEKRALVEAKRSKRTEIQAKLQTLEAERNQHVAAEEAKLNADSDKTLEGSMIKSVKTSASKKGYKF
jgi:hypothetical protein